MAASSCVKLFVGLLNGRRLRLHRRRCVQSRRSTTTGSRSWSGWRSYHANLVASALGGIYTDDAGTVGIDPAVASDAFVTTVTDVIASFPSSASPRWSGLRWIGERLFISLIDLDGPGIVVAAGNIMRLRLKADGRIVEFQDRQLPLQPGMPARAGPPCGCEIAIFAAARLTQQPFAARLGVPVEHPELGTGQARATRSGAALLAR